MLSRNVQLALNDFVYKYAFEKNLNPDEIFSRLGLIERDSTAQHIIAFYQTWKYAIAKRELAGLVNGLKIFTAWKYFDLLTGEQITNVLFVANTELETIDDVTKIFSIAPKKVDLIEVKKDDLKIVETKKIFDLNKLDKNYTPYKPDETDLIYEDNAEVISQAGFNYKNILWIGLIGAAIYLVMK